MARSTSSLPDRLRYLQPFREKFASRSDELNESNGEAPLFTLFSRHIKGLPAMEAQKLLEEDLAVLEEWLSAPEHENDCLQFVRGFLLVSPSELAKRILKEMASPPSSPPRVDIELPPDVKVKRMGNRNEVAIILKWKGLRAILESMPEERALKHVKHNWDERPKSKVASSTVRFGNVHGTKFVRVTDFVMLLGTHLKEVGYLLYAPGGVVSISARPFSKKINQESWDESVLENLFHTLQVVHKGRTD